MNNQISFGIYANQSDKRWNTFIEEMNERFNLEWFGHNESGYGVDKSGSAITGSHAFVKSHVKTVITLDDYFAEGSVYRVIPDKQKEMIISFVESLSLGDKIEMINHLLEMTERQKLQQEIEQLEKELNVKRDKLKEYGN